MQRKRELTVDPDRLTVNNFQTEPVNEQNQENTDSKAKKQIKTSTYCTNISDGTVSLRDKSLSILIIIGITTLVFCLNQESFGCLAFFFLLYAISYTLLIQNYHRL